MGRANSAPPAPAVEETVPRKRVELEALVSFNNHLVGDTWVEDLTPTVIAYVDSGWVIVIGVDGFTLPK